MSASLRSTPIKQKAISVKYPGRLRFTNRPAQCHDPPAWPLRFLSKLRAARMRRETLMVPVGEVGSVTSIGAGRTFDRDQGRRAAQHCFFLTEHAGFGWEVACATVEKDCTASRNKVAAVGYTPSAKAGRTVNLLASKGNASRRRHGWCRYDNGRDCGH